MSTIDMLQVRTRVPQLPEIINKRASELIEMVHTHHPKARVIGPTYWSDEPLWLIDAFFDDGEDFELQESLSERSTDILLEDGICMGVLLMPLSAYEPSQ